MDSDFWGFLRKEFFNSLLGGTLARTGTTTSTYTNTAAWSGYGTISAPLNNSSGITVTSGKTLVLGGALTNTGTFDVTGAGTTLTNSTGSSRAWPRLISPAAPLTAPDTATPVLERLRRH